MTEQIEKVFQQYSTEKIVSTHKLPQAGSDRQYYRILTPKGSYIVTHGNNVRENQTFIYFSKLFSRLQLATPTVLWHDEGYGFYIQEDIGTKSLLDILETEGYTDHLYQLYKNSLAQLAKLQVLAHSVIDYNNCLTNTIFGKQAIMADLLYFKYYFLDSLGKPYDKQKLIDDFEALSNYLSHTEYRYFMFRDFQSRNIMIADDNSIRFIDYQGGMEGAPQYDVASLLWQAKANLPAEWKQRLLKDYTDAFEKETGHVVNRDIFTSQYNGYVLIRLLQVLGAYGFRGLFERKAHFLTSIPLALENLSVFLREHSIGIALPEFKKILSICTSEEIIKRFTPVQANANTPLTVYINSFSYKKGIPADESENGGGFVFDMRGILNPGRFEEYKKLSGLDKPVKDFLEQKTQMPVFLNSVYTMVDISVTDYIHRGFASLMVNFGCTGGQHRSVYAAESLARHLRNKFKVKTMLHHTNQQNWVK